MYWAFIKKEAILSIRGELTGAFLIKFLKRKSHTF